MRLMVTCITSMFLFVGQVARAGDNFPIWVYPAPKAAQAPTLDGRLDDACWKPAPEANDFAMHMTLKRAQIQTRFRVTYDDKCLYLAVVCDEPLAGRLHKGAPGAHDDPAIFQQECIELFVDPFHNHRDYYQIIVNVSATVSDNSHMDKTWNSRTRSATRIGSDRWSMEIAVPWADLGVRRIKPGMLMGLSVCRDREIGQRRWSSWCHMPKSFHRVGIFGHLVLSTDLRKVGALAAEFRKGDRRGPILFVSSAALTGPAYLKLARGALGGLDSTLDRLEQTARNDSPAAARLMAERTHKVRATVKPIRDRLARASAMNAAEWTRINHQLDKVQAGLSDAIWEVRLQVVLDTIKAPHDKPRGGSSRQ